MEAINVSLVKQINKIVFDSSDDYHLNFGRELAKNGFSVLEAFYKTYYQVNKIRASQLLEDTSVWKVFFEELVKREEHTTQERDWLEAYNLVKDNYIFDPFSLYVYYVEKDQEIKQSVASVISSDPVKDLQVLIYLYHFFTVLNREHFLRKIKPRITEELAQLAITDNKDLSRIRRQCLKDNIEVDEII